MLAVDGVLGIAGNDAPQPRRLRWNGLLQEEGYAMSTGRRLQSMAVGIPAAGGNPGPRRVRS